ncbi:MAG TPA: superoxide dismutase [Thermoanaerobaculia bacterium]|nr:superoxide dismutase [Thermoanaerobaculia bacterium]
MAFATYKPKQFNLSGLSGISDETLEMHFTLYEGYVTNTNELNERVAELVRGGKVDDERTIVFSELKRRLGFEYNGMILHEYYFENMKKQGGGDAAGEFRSAVEEAYGGYENWKADFTAVGMMRGIGWAICYQDPTSGTPVNVWVDEHHVNNLAGYTPLLVMDVWEHAFLRDYAPAEKGKYIDSFFSNINWTAVEKRIEDSRQLVTSR